MEDLWWRLMDISLWCPFCTWSSLTGIYVLLSPAQRTWTIKQPFWMPWSYGTWSISAQSSVISMRSKGSVLIHSCTSKFSKWEHQARVMVLKWWPFGRIHSDAGLMPGLSRLDSKEEKSRALPEKAGRLIHYSEGSSFLPQQSCQIRALCSSQPKKALRSHKWLTRVA